MPPQVGLRTKMKKTIMLLFLAVLLALPLVNSHFVCGHVEDSNDNFSASWFSVKVYYPSTPSSYASCDVSPDGNKYCCDATSIPGKTWKIGDVLNAEIIDQELGYVAGPVSITTTGEGYDVFPEMRIEKVINVYSPLDRIILSNSSGVLLNLSFLSPYTNVSLKIVNLSQILCSNCSSYENYTNGDYGMNLWTIFASDNSRAFSSNLSFAILSSINFDRILDCDKCRNNRVKRDQIVNMTLDLNLSDDVENLELREYVPVDWEILDDSLDVKRYSPTHNVIIWNVSGSNIRKSYLVQAPSISFLPYKYIFRTELEDEALNEEEVTVYRAFYILALGKRVQKFDFNFSFKNRISPSKPLVINNKGHLDTIAVFPKLKLNDVYLILRNYNFDDELENSLGYYAFDTNIKKSDIDKMYSEIRIEKSLLETRGFTGINLYLYDGEWKQLEVNISQEDSKHLNYKFFFSPSEGMAIVGR